MDLSRMPGATASIDFMLYRVDVPPSYTRKKKEKEKEEERSQGLTTRLKRVSFRFVGSDGEIPRSRFVLIPPA